MQEKSSSLCTFVAQFVVWGAGKYGRVLIDLLGNERIVAFIESDAKRIGTTYDGIPIIDFDTYKRDFKHYPIIVSVKQAEKEIVLSLHQEGIEWAFPLMSNLVPIEGFLRQAPIEQILHSYNRKEIIYVYGYTPLGLLIYDYLTNNRYQCKMLLQSSANELLSQYLKKNLVIRWDTLNNLSNGGRVLLATEADKRDEPFLNRIPIETWYNLGEQELYVNHKIEKFKGIYEGKRCFAVATGPSLTVEDLDTLHENQELCFSVNGIFKIFESTHWRPDFYLLSDLSGMLSWKKEILEMDVKNKFIADVAWNLKENEAGDNIYKWHMQRTWECGKEPEFSEDFARKSFWGRTVIYDGVLQLAAYMGFKEIYLVGTDCCQYDDQKKQHFVSNYSMEKSILNINDILLAYKAAKRYADSHGIKIYNATHGGKLEIFERVDFDSLFPKIDMWRKSL